MFRRDHRDVPFIANYMMHELEPELRPAHIWRIFNLDLEHGKFVALKGQVEAFLANVQTLQADAAQKAELEAYIQQVHYVQRHRDLRNYEPLIDFFKSYFQSELEKLVTLNGPEKKLPGQRRHFVSQSRAQRIDQFARRFVLRPLHFLENVTEDRVVHRPELPQNLKFKDVLNEYVAPEADGEVDKKKAERFLADALLYVAVELWCQPQLRKTFKDHVREHGVLMTQPTEKGAKELDLLHSSYRVKRLNKRLTDLENTDLFLDVLQNAELGLITYRIDVPQQEEFFDRIFERYDVGADQAGGEVDQAWATARKRVKEQFLKASNPMMSSSAKGAQQRTFAASMLEEIRDELREDAEAHVIGECKATYSELIKMGYFRVDGERPQHRNEDRTADVELVEQRERPCVMGAILYPLDNKNFQTMVAIVNKDGELVYSKEFFHLLPPRQFKPRDREGFPGGGMPDHQRRPGEIEEQENHDRATRQL
jgi:transcriptional accessory protein Tex/SPT6